MSEHSYAGLVFKQNLERNPGLMDHVFDHESVNKRTTATIQAAQDLDAKNAQLKVEPVRVQYNTLRKQLFDLQEWAKHAEIYCNSKAGEVKQLERRITDIIKQKKAAVDNPRAERNFEHQIQLLETELLDAEKEFKRAKIQSGNAARGLKAFDGHQRIKELKKELGE